MCKLHKEERGTASVLVVFMMILLVTFGSMALSSAMSNQRLGLLSTAWMTDYYWMDAEAEMGLYAIDQVLTQAELVAQSELGRGYTAFAAAYTREAKIGLTSAAEEHGWELTDTQDGMKISFTVKGEFSTVRRTQDKYLTVEITFEVPQYDFEPETGWRRKEGTSRFSVQRWQEWQEIIRINEGIQFWDGVLPQ